MIFVSAFFAISWLPLAVFNLMFNVAAGTMLPDRSIFYYEQLFISFLYICTNPFIYAIKFNPVTRVLLELVPCMKNRVESESIDMA